MDRPQNGPDPKGDRPDDNSQPSAYDEFEAFQARQRRLILLTAITANLFGNIGLIGINVALPSITREMDLSPVRMNWVTLSTMLFMAMFSSPIARIADLIGRRRIAIFGLWTTVIASAGCAVSQGFWILLLFRALTGLGLVSFFTTVTTMVTAAYPLKERGRVLGLTISSVYIGLTMGPIVAGVIVEHLGWQSLFWFTVVGMIPTMILIHQVRPETMATASGEKLDWLGAILWIIAVALMFSGLASLGQSKGWIPFAAGLILMVFFVRVSLGSKNPVLDMRLFLDSRRFSFSSLAAYISYFSSTSVSFLLSLYLQYSRHLSPAQAGLFLVAQPVVQASLTPLSGRLSDRYDAGRLASAGMTIIMATIIIFATNIGVDTPTILLIATMALTGAGFAFFSAPNTNAIMSAVSRERLGQASGVITVTRLFGQISSIALITIVFNYVIGPGSITENKYPAFITASRICFLIFAPLCLTGILASLARGKSERVE